MRHCQSTTQDCFRVRLEKKNKEVVSMGREEKGPKPKPYPLRNIFPNSSFDFGVSSAAMDLGVVKFNISCTITCREV